MPDTFAIPRSMLLPVSSEARPPAQPRVTGSSFGEVLSARSSRLAPVAAPRPSPLERMGQRFVSQIAQDERRLESVVRGALSGAALTPADLLALQARVYRYAQQLELASKVVDRATSALRTVLQQG